MPDLAATATASRGQVATLRRQHSRRCKSMAEISTRPSRQPLSTPDDTNSLISFPDPTAQTAPLEDAPRPSPPSQEDGAAEEPLYGLLDRLGPTMFDEQTEESTQPQTLATASAEVLRGVIDHQGAAELVRRLSSMLAERDAHITALTRLAEEYKIPRDRIVDTASRAKQAERRRQSLATASEDLAPSNGSPSDSGVCLCSMCATLVYC